MKRRSYISNSGLKNPAPDYSSGTCLMAYADRRGRVYDYPDAGAAFRSGHRFLDVYEKELIRLPYGSSLFTLPDRYPVASDGDSFSAIKKDPEGRDISGVSAFLASGYLRTYLPAYERKSNSVALPLWAYAGLVVREGEFYVPAMRIDGDPRSDPAIHENHSELKKAINAARKEMKGNRLVDQLSRCSLHYNCLCSRNFFLGRYECPVPTSPACNADCLGCLSDQDETSGFSQSHYRIDFSPSPDEIADIISRHFSRVGHAVASFGQGCEGEPLLVADNLLEAIGRVRAKTSRGTVNLNTNGSIPDRVKDLISAGLDSIRVSLCSPTKKYYDRYHRPLSYRFDDVIRTVELSLEAGIFVSINLFFMPGFTDSFSEVESLFRFLDRFPVSMIQTRNMNIDPDYFFENIGFPDEDFIGIRGLIDMLGSKYPAVKLGYYNPPIRE